MWNQGVVSGTQYMKPTPEVVPAICLISYSSTLLMLQQAEIKSCYFLVNWELSELKGKYDK